MLRTTVRAAAEMPAWEIADAAMGGVWRFNAALRYARDTRLYPYALEVVIPFALPRTYTRRFTEHPALILGARAVAVSAVLFALLALTRVPAWIGLITSLLAGAALVAGVRVARSSTGRAVVRRARRGSSQLRRARAALANGYQIKRPVE